MANEIIITLVGLFCTTVSSIVTFILTRRKYNAEVDSQQIENMNKSFDMYKKVMEDTINAQNQKIETLQKENEALRSQISTLQSQMVNFVLGTNLTELKDKLMPLTDILKTEIK